MHSKEYDICVVGGLGHVGLPLGISLAKSGKKVMLYDINEQSFEKVARGEMPFLEEGAEKALKEVLNQTLFCSTDRRAISKAHFIVVVIGTPVDEHLNPKFTIFRDFFDQLLDMIHDGQHIILRSTIYPGTTEKIKQYLELKNKRVMISFCPERIAQGKAMAELHSLPQIISSCSPEAFREAKELFSLLNDEVIELSPLEAELAKLFTNIWRYMLFSISNQFYQIATQQELDFYRIYHAITYKYPRSSGFPKAGFAAGPCLFKDTMQLAAFSNNNFFLGHAAMLINEGFPNFLVENLKKKYLLREKTVGVLGMAFKANNDDKRESLSYKLKKILDIEAKSALCSDVYIKEDGFVTPEDLMRDSDIVILATPHNEYRKLKIPEGKVLIDIWDFYGNGGGFK